MEELIKRLEAATGPDWELDEAIMYGLNASLRITWGRGDQCMTVAEALAHAAQHNSPTGWIRRAVASELGSDDTPRYTDSVDAALSLVPEACGWEIYNTTCDQPKVWAKVYGWLGCTEAVRANSVTAPLALCIVALRARMTPRDHGAWDE